MITKYGVTYDPATVKVEAYMSYRVVVTEQGGKRFVMQKDIESFAEARNIAGRLRNPEVRSHER